MKDDETVRQAKRTLDRIGEEGGLSSTPIMKSAATGVRDHFAAKDADTSDKVEVWGTRIARGLALVAFIGLVVLAGRADLLMTADMPAQSRYPQSRSLVISSHVVRGSVGNRAAVFALETLGFPVWAVPTVILPWHPGHSRATRIVPGPPRGLYIPE